MESACDVYEQTTVIHELTQGIEMAKQLRLNLNSAEARQFLIQKILSSYDKALFVLKSSGQLQASPLSSISTGSPQIGEFQFDRNVISKKRKLPTPWDNHEYEINDKAPKRLATKQVIKLNNDVVQSAPPPPPSPEKYEIKPTNHHHHHQLSSPNPEEALSNLRANLSVNTWDLGATLPSSFSFPSTPFGFSDDDFEPINFPNFVDDDELLLQGYSSPLFSSATSESNYLTDWGSSSSSPLDFPTDHPVDLYADFEFNNVFL